MISIDVRHDGLGRLARVAAPVKALAEQRARSFSKRWDEAMKRRQGLSEIASSEVVDAVFKLEAEENTKKAEEAISALTSILLSAAAHSSAIDWSPQYDTAEFSEPLPLEPHVPMTEIEPQPSDFKRSPLTLMTLLNPSVMRKRKEDAKAKFEAAHNGWLYLKRWRELEFSKTFDAYRAAAEQWQQRKDVFADAQSRANARIDAMVRGYAWGEPEAVISHCDMALLSLDRPEGFPVFWTMSFADGVLQIDYDLPSMAQVPLLKAVKYVAAKRAFETVTLSEKERERLYSEAVFQSVLAVLHTLFTADTAGHIQAITFNGWANFIDSTAMRPGRACILSVVTARQHFSEIDLTVVDPKACFRAFNGVISPKLAALVERSAI